jgi:hypothetical protein
MVYIYIVLIYGEIYPLRWNCQVGAWTLAFILRGHSIFFQAGMASEGGSFVRIDSFVWAPVLCPSGGIDICCNHGPENSFRHRCVTPATDCYIYICVCLYTYIYMYICICICCHLNEVRSHLSINKTKFNCHPQQLQISSLICQDSALHLRWSLLWQRWRRS